jgi:hypothetical protein
MSFGIVYMFREGYRYLELCAVEWQLGLKQNLLFLSVVECLK